MAAALGQLTAPIKLSSLRQGNDLILQWPLSGAGRYLAATTNLSAASSWQPQPELTTLYTQERFQATAPINTPPRRYFRLQSP